MIGDFAGVGVGHGSVSADETIPNTTSISNKLIITIMLSIKRYPGL